MDWHLDNKASSLYVEFLSDGEFVVPDAGSIFLTLRNNAGTVISGYDSLALADVTVSTMLYSVPQAVNVIGAVDFETRYARVDFKYEGKPLVSEQVYKLGPFLPISANEAEVRSLFGVRELELPDSDIDLRGAFYLLKEDYPEAMATSLTATATSWWANRAIILMAAQQVGPSLPVRALKQEDLNNANQIRANIDWERVMAGIMSEFSIVMNKLQEAASVAGGGTPTPILVLSLPTDPVTNA
jgi:hypothetical protein